MGLKESMSAMKELMEEMCADLEKSAKGNKAAAQRVRTASIKFAKVSKNFRKESVSTVDRTSKVMKSKKAAKKKR